MKTAEIFEIFPGHWQMARIILGRGRLDGEVTFTRMSPSQLRYDETGLLQLDGSAETFEATRSYLYELRDDRLFIFYNDGDRSGDVLHELTFRDEYNIQTASHCHVCAKDVYDLTLRIESQNNLTMLYEIRGPKKSYTMQTSLTRVL